MTEPLATDARPRRRHVKRRFAVAFLAGILSVLALGVGGLYAYDLQYVGRILPGVSVGGIDLSGMDPDGARQRLTEAFGHVGGGRVLLDGPAGELTLGYAELGRAPDIDGMLGAALAAGRETGVARLVQNARTALNGVTIGPAATLDVASLDASLQQVADALDQAPVEATISLTDGEFSTSNSKLGRAVDLDSLRASLISQLSVVDAPGEIRLDIPMRAIEPVLSTEDVQQALAAAERLTQPLDLTVGDEKWTISTKRLRMLMEFRPTVDGGVTPIIDVAGFDPVLSAIAKKVERTPKSASYLVGNSGKIVGVTAGANGRRLLVERTRARVVDALMDRIGGATTKAIEPVVQTRRPRLTTEEAERAAPLMKRISTWTTWFPIGEKNGFGANIWLPAEFIDGYVVAPGETFSFWKAVGPVTRARGFKQGGAIIDGRTQPQGALAGGICSCSTTLFNAAMRAGYKMGSRRNHYYYIDRYPIGLDATVLKSGSSVQDMTWTNDTKYPVLIRGINTRNGGKGFVRFDLYSVPTGRKVSISRATVKNVLPGRDSVQYTSSLPTGRSQRIEWPVDGKDVWVTVTVTEKGRLISRRTYYSHYARITGIVLIGR
jgi:vancomycin resistance protein YoaR